MVISPLICPAPAKINLYLHVTGRRDDGFHLLDSLVAFVGIHDTVTVSPADHLELRIDGPCAGPLQSEGHDDNLVLRAARALARAAGIAPNAAIGLTKRLPVASGMGGGSADAAATLRGLCRLWNLNAAADDVFDLALGLGADVPVCLYGKTAFVGGIGEEISPAHALPPCSIVLVNADERLSTPTVFAARQGGFSDAGRFDYAPKDAAELAAVLASRHNDLYPPAVCLMPSIGDVLKAIGATDGVLLSRMTGSGATCFGLFASPGDAAAAAMALGRAHPEWWVKAGSLESDITRMPPTI